MSLKTPVFHTDVEACVDALLTQLGKRIVLSLPLGIGKATHVANALFRRATHDSDIHLQIFTALTPERPLPGSELELRLLSPISERIFGDYPDLDYAVALRRDTLPPNIEVSEFYFSPGAWLSSPAAQRAYVCANYTDAARALLERGVNVIAQLVAPPAVGGNSRYSLSCNPDITLDLLSGLKTASRPVALVGQVNRNLPFMPGAAVLSAGAFDHILDAPRYHHALFAPPNEPVSVADYAAGLRVATLVKDGGTLQIGIGSIGDAVTHSLKLRHQENVRFREIVSALNPAVEPGSLKSEIQPFVKGLSAASEMFVDGLFELYKAGVLKRAVYPDARVQALLNNGVIEEEITAKVLHTFVRIGLVPAQLDSESIAYLKQLGVLRDEVEFVSDALESPTGERITADLANRNAFDRIAKHCLGTRLKGGAVIHSAFFLGPRAFYAALKALPEDELARFVMTGVSYVNTLHGKEALKRAQRKDARFVNNAMIATLNGAVVSDGLEDGRVVSGVGGQHDFVTMAQALPDARSIIVLNSVRQHAGKASSNIRWSYGHVTIPRHLRDIVVTEYGIADLRGRSDRDVIAAMLNLADSRFQQRLLARAKEAGKIERAYEIPPPYRENYPDVLSAKLAGAKESGMLPDFPYGSDLSVTEAALIKALKYLKNKTRRKISLLATAARALSHVPPSAQERESLARLGLDRPDGIKKRWHRHLVLHALRTTK